MRGHALRLEASALNEAAKQRWREGRYSQKVGRRTETRCTHRTLPQPATNPVSCHQVTDRATDTTRRQAAPCASPHPHLPDQVAGLQGAVGRQLWGVVIAVGWWRKDL